MSGSTETAVEKPGVQVFVIFKYIEIELLEPFFLHECANTFSFFTDTQMYEGSILILILSDDIC